MASLADLHRRALDEMGRRVVATERWDVPTPCSEWDTRHLVHHVVEENLWAPPLLAGATVEEIGPAFEGDLLGDDPAAAWEDSAGPAAAASAEVDLDATVHLSFGDVPASEYVWQLTADATVHAWDLARATGGDERLDEELVAAVLEWFTGREQMYRDAGVIGPPADPGPDPSPTSLLVARFGRAPQPG